MKSAVIQKEPEKEPSLVIEIPDVLSIWVPDSKMTKALAVKTFYPKLTADQVIKEPPPIPPHVAVAFDTLKRLEVLALIEDYRAEVMRYGFFTSDDPDEAELISKIHPNYVRKAAENPSDQYRLVVQLSKKKSDAMLAFAQMGPTYISPNEVVGASDCKRFFPEDYDEPEEEIVEIIRKPSISKKKKKKPVKEEVVAEEIVAEEAPTEVPEGQEAPAEEAAAEEDVAHEELEEEEVAESMFPDEGGELHARTSTDSAGAAKSQAKLQRASQAASKPAVAGEEAKEVEVKKSQAKIAEEKSEAKPPENAEEEAKPPEG